MLPGTQDDNVIILAGSLHTHVHAHWIPTHPCPCLLDPHMHTLTGYTHTHAPGPCTLAHSQGPCMHTHTRSLCPLTHGAHLACSHQVPCPLTHRAHLTHTHQVPMPTRLQGPHTSTHRAMHARSHWAPTPARSPCMLMRCRHGSMHEYVQRDNLEPRARCGRVLARQASGAATRAAQPPQPHNPSSSQHTATAHPH